MRVDAYESDKKTNMILNQSWHQTLASVYKSIGRHLLRTQLAEHDGCIEKIGRNLQWDKFWLSQKGAICEGANAYLLWRMFYEELGHPVDIFRKYKSKVIRKPLLDWTFPGQVNNSRRIQLKVFALEVYWVFYECKALARQFREQSLYSLNDIYITKKMTPHWLAKRCEKQRIWEFHYWLQASHLNLVSSEIKH